MAENATASELADVLDWVLYRLCANKSLGEFDLDAIAYHLDKEGKAGAADFVRANKEKLPGRLKDRK